MKQGFGEGDDLLGRGDTEQALYHVHGDMSMPIRHELIEQTQRITHTAGGRSCNRFGDSRINLVGFARGNLAEMGHCVADVVPVKRVALTTRQNGGRNFVDFCGSQDKNRMGGWLFESLEQCVKCSCGQHVYFVDDVDFVAPHGWTKLYAFDDFTGIINTGM